MIFSAAGGQHAVDELRAADQRLQGERAGPGAPARGRGRLEPPQRHEGTAAIVAE